MNSTLLTTGICLHLHNFQKIYHVTVVKIWVIYSNQKWLLTSPKYGESSFFVFCSRHLSPQGIDACHKKQRIIISSITCIIITPANQNKPKILSKLKFMHYISQLFNFRMLYIPCFFKFCSDQSILLLNSFIYFCYITEYYHIMHSTIMQY